MRLYLICIASILIHLAFFEGLSFWASLIPADKPKETIEVAIYPEGEILEALLPKQQQVVRQALVPEKMKAPEDETLPRFLSEKKQRVREESQAAQTGMTQNRAATAQPARKSSPSSSNENSILDRDGFEKFDVSKNLKSMQEFERGSSTIGESLPEDVKIGSFTALNTDRYLFYTFYARVEEMIRFRWESRVQQIIQSMPPPIMMQTSNRNWVTQVEFLLDRRGNLQKALLMKGSGVTAFDTAAIMAFKEARIFPNPPQEMIQDDGYIHLKYSFTVRFAPPALVNRN